LKRRRKQKTKKGEFNILQGKGPKKDRLKKNFLNEGRAYNEGGEQEPFPTSKVNVTFPLSGHKRGKILRIKGLLERWLKATTPEMIGTQPGDNISRERTPNVGFKEKNDFCNKRSVPIVSTGGRAQKTPTTSQKGMGGDSQSSSVGTVSLTWKPRKVCSDHVLRQKQKGPTKKVFRKGGDVKCLEAERGTTSY